MEKEILLLLLVIMFLNLTLTTVADVDAVRVPFCATKSVKDSIFGLRDQTCSVSGVESDERPRFVAVTEVIEISISRVSA